MIERFRMRPMQVRAVQFEDTPARVTQISELVDFTLRVSYAEPGKPVLKIETPFQHWSANVGDWVILHEDGEVEVCSPQMFGQKYELVEPKAGANS